MKNKLLITLILFAVLLVGLFLFANNGNCSISDNQKKILSSEIPNNSTLRSEMMKEVEKDMKPLDYLCMNNAQQLLVKRFGLVPLEK